MSAAPRIARRLVVPVVLLGLAGTGRAVDPPPTENAQIPSVRAIPEDRSLSLDEYLQSGVPASDRPWSGADMARAADRLTAAGQADRARLPRYGSKRSGELFARLTASRNLDLYRNRTLPLMARLPDGLKYLESFNRLVKAYLSAFQDGAVGGDEIIELLGATMRVTTVLMGCVDEFVPTIPKDAPNYATRMAGLNQMKEGMASIVMGTLQTLSEKDEYRVDERLRLLGYMRESIPAILPRLLPGTRKEIAVRVKGMAKDADLKELQPALDDFSEAIRRVAD